MNKLTSQVERQNITFLFFLNKDTVSGPEYYGPKETTKKVVLQAQSLSLLGDL